MNLKPALRAIVGALACVLCGAVAAQPRYGASPRGGFGMGRGMYERAGPSMGRGQIGPPGGYSSYPQAYGPPPRYASPLPRRPYDAPPDWRAAPRRPPGLAGPRQPEGAEVTGMASLSWVIESIRRRSPGRQLDTDLAYMDGRPIYRVRWLTDHGRRMDYLVDAETGVILSGR